VLAPQRMVDQSYLRRVGFNDSDQGLALEVAAG
jgi:hypothetical protein